MTALLTDLYQLSMLQAYLAERMEENAVFELFVRKLPPTRNFLVAAGLEQALAYLESLSFTEDEIRWVEQQGSFSAQLVRYLREFRFTGDVDAVPEGTVFFPDEPILRVSAPLPQAQFVESRLLNIVHLQTLIASKAARIALRAPGRQLVDFGMRRAHGAEAALFAARAAYVAGFEGTATTLAGMRYDIPVYGTMAHSFVQVHASEQQAFEAFCRARPRNPVLLVDTYDTEAAVEKVAALAPMLAREGIRISAVRLDSGDLAAHAKATRSILDRAGLHDVGIFASGNIDEHRIDALLAAGAPIDGFGVGTALDTSSDAPALDMVYKLQSYAGQPRRKRSEGKATWPGPKQVYRHRDGEGHLVHDVVRLDTERSDGEPLLRPCLRAGRRVLPQPSLGQLRSHCAAELAALPEPLRALAPAETPYRAAISEELRALAHRLDALEH